MRRAKAVHAYRIGRISVTFGSLHLLIIDVDSTASVTTLALA